ncbi:hypothetical protein GCM10017691_47110 [Pseudonocardia petroleophila]
MAPAAPPQHRRPRVPPHVPGRGPLPRRRRGGLHRPAVGGVLSTVVGGVLSTVVVDGGVRPVDPVLGVGSVAAVGGTVRAARAAGAVLVHPRPVDERGPGRVRAVARVVAVGAPVAVEHGETGVTGHEHDVPGTGEAVAEEVGVGRAAAQGEHHAPRGGLGDHELDVVPEVVRRVVARVVAVGDERSAVGEGDVAVLVGPHLQRRPHDGEPLRRTGVEVAGDLGPVEVLQQVGRGVGEPEERLAPARQRPARHRERPRPGAPGGAEQAVPRRAAQVEREQGGGEDRGHREHGDQRQRETHPGHGGGR